MRGTDLLKFIQNAPHRLIPRCVITQSSGKQRVIDNADVGGQSESSREPTASALLSFSSSPADRSHLVIDDTRRCGHGQGEWHLANRRWGLAKCIPTQSHDPHEALGCVVTFWHHEWGCPAYQVYTGLLFGLPLAVTSFNRYSRLAEALGRRLTFSLVSLYFDDATVVDWASSKGSAQWAFGELNKLLGTPFAADKRQLMATAGTFLGLHHDFEHCMTTGGRDFLGSREASSKDHWCDPPISFCSESFSRQLHPNCMGWPTSSKWASTDVLAAEVLQPSRPGSMNVQPLLHQQFHNLLWGPSCSYPIPATARIWGATSSACSVLCCFGHCLGRYQGPAQEAFSSCGSDPHMNFVKAS